MNKKEYNVNKRLSLFKECDYGLIRCKLFGIDISTDKLNKTTFQAHYYTDRECTLRIDFEFLLGNPIILSKRM